MAFWKNLFKNRAAPQPAAQPVHPVHPVRPTQLEAEILRLDAIDAIDARPPKLAYWRTLHPLVQAYWVGRVGWEQEETLPIDRADAASVFYRWGYPTGTYSFQIRPRQQEWMQRYGSVKDALWQQVKEAQLRFTQHEEEADRMKEQAWQAYWAHYETLPVQTKHLVAWELAKRGYSQGRSGFHGGGGLLPFPFSTCGWADYEEPKWGPTQGVAFRVRMSCFGDRKPLLYYLDDDNWPRPEQEQEKLAIIARYSSGISNVRVEQRRCAGWDGNEAERRVVLFEPDPAAIKQTVMLSGEAVPTSELGEYIFVLPTAGEFYCVLGEVQNGELIPLHKDDFCMK